MKATIAESGGIPSSERWKALLAAAIEASCPGSSKALEVYRYLQSAGREMEGAAETLWGRGAWWSERERQTPGRRGRSRWEALRELGLDGLGRSALRRWLREMTLEALEAYGRSGASFLRVSFACGAAMRLLHADGVDEREPSYAIGLLSGVGGLLLERTLRGEGGSAALFRARSPRELAEKERSLLGLDHAQAGGLALRSWGFGREVYRPISEQFGLPIDALSFEWVQSLSVARFIAERTQEVDAGRKDVLRGEGKAQFRGRSLSEIFEYSLAEVEASPEEDWLWGEGEQPGSGPSAYCSA